MRTTGVSPPSPHPPDGDERPLDAHETREFERIMAAYRRTARRTRRVPNPAQPTLRWRTVVLVLLASTVFAGASALLPAPANLWSPVGLLVAVAVVSLLRAVWSARRGHGH